MDKFTVTIDEEVRPLMEGHVLNASIVEDLDTVGSLAEVFAILQFLESKIKTRKEVIRQRLLRKVELVGKETDMGGQIARTDYGSVTREKRISKMPDDDEIKAVLAEHGLSVKEVFTDQVTQVLDPSKLQALIARGKLPKGTIEKARKVTYALKFKPTRDVSEQLNALTEGEE